MSQINRFVFGFASGTHMFMLNQLIRVEATFDTIIAKMQIQTDIKSICIMQSTLQFRCQIQVLPTFPFK